MSSPRPSSTPLWVPQGSPPLRPRQPDRRRTKHVLEATNELADEIAEAYGTDTPAVEHARAEIARVRG